MATTDDFDEWFAGLSEEAQVEIIAKVELLKVLGPALGRTHADTLNGSKYANMKELRADTARQVLRVAFAFDPERAAILLVAGDKSGVSQKRFYKRLIAKADECAFHNRRGLSHFAQPSEQTGTVPLSGRLWKGA